MQINSASPNPTVPVNPTATTNLSPTDLAVAASSGSANAAGAGSFEKCLPENSPVPGKVVRKAGPETENAAGIMAASLWMPGVPPESPAPSLPPASPAKMAGATVPLIGPGGSGQATEAAGKNIFGPAVAQPMTATRMESAGPVPPAIDTMAQSGTAESAKKSILPGTAMPAPAAASPAKDQPGLMAAALVESSAVTPPPGAPPRRSASFPPAPAANPKGVPVVAAPGAEKIAGLGGDFPHAAAKTLPAGIKEILSPAHEPVAASTAKLGTDVALSAAPMSFAPSSRARNFSVNLAGLSISAGNPFGASLTAEPASLVATLRETMSAVVHAVATLERRADIQPQRVDLHFQIGGEPIALRVELKSGTVHTTFQTGSDEMRSALRQEWQAVVPPALGSHLRLADPVFNVPAAGNPAFDLGGQGARPQHGQSAPEPAPGFRSAPAADAEWSDSSPAPAADPQPLSLLNAFA